MLLILFILKIVMATDGNNGSCGAAFKGKCWCGETNYDRLQQYVVNCTNEGFSNTSVLEHMPKDVETLIFTGNNHIREIRGKTYHHVHQVERLILNHNNLSVSKEDHLHPRILSNFIKLKALHLTNAFSDYTSSELSEVLHAIFVKSNLTNLQKLHLEQNEISQFKDQNVFCDLPHLEDLYLADNNLKEINFNVICLHNLRFLDLERNRFYNFKKRDIEALEMLEALPDRTENLILDFNMNPLACDCIINDLVKWIKSSTNITIRNKDSLMCHHSDDHTEHITLLNFMKCNVKSQRFYNGGHQVFLAFSLIVFIFVLVTLCGAILHVNKYRIRYISVVSTRKVHYTSIRDDETTQEVHV